MRVIGLISGTSVDGIDAALVEIEGSAANPTIHLTAGATYAYPPALRQRILAIASGAPLSLEALAELDDAIATQFAQAALQIQRGQPAADLIGSHGQTVFHRPRGIRGNLLGYSLQLGRGALIAHLTRMPTISNFRAADIAAGGEGAPLVPAVDAALLKHPSLSRCVQNIGGIGNVTYLPAGEQMPAGVIGWDTGPGNVLLDLAVQHFSQGQQSYDQDGAWAARGTPDHTLVAQWLQQDFFRQPPPKSTGRERFGRAYLDQCLRQATERGLSAADGLATLTDFTAAAIADSYQRFLPALPDQVLLCGGGSKNPSLRQRIQTHLPGVSVLTTDQVGLSADFKEAIAFAILAYWRLHQIPGNLPAVTGAGATVLLGEISTAG